MSDATDHARPLPGVFAARDDRHTFRALLSRGALVALSTSGGKDSQAATILLSRIVPADQMVLFHAPLRDAEWPGTQAHIERYRPPGVPLILTHTASGKTLLERVEERGQWPDPARRWCTADFKRTPIEREIRRYLKANPRHRGLVVSAMGHRAEESAPRRRTAPWRYNPRNSKAGRTWYDWFPIHALLEHEVFQVIRDAGEEPHWAYAAGATRVSCSFCVMGSKNDLCVAARLRPYLYRRYARLERRIGHTLSPSRRPLPQITGIPA